MSSDFDATVADEKDRTKWWWGGVLVLVVLMIVIQYKCNPFNPSVSVVRAKHILFTYDPADPAGRSRSLETAQQVRQRLLNGESFSKLAKEYSQDSLSAARGGDLGWNRRGVFDAPFDLYVWTAPLNEISDIIQTRYGYHLVTVVDRRLSKADEIAQEEKRRAFQRGMGASPDAGAPNTPSRTEEPAAAGRPQEAQNSSQGQP